MNRKTARHVSREPDFSCDPGNDSNIANGKEPIAIVGIGCRFPGGANTPQKFWQLLCRGVDAITKIPEDRWNVDKFYHPDPTVPGATYSCWGGFIENIDKFEPECFGISPREALFIDPQQRLLLEVTWEALEDGGQVISEFKGTNTGVFVGISTTDYSQIQSSPNDRRSIDAHSATGGAASMAANRISYCFDLHGPSFSVDTACSSSLVATHLACASIWSKECDQAVSAGVNLMIAPWTFISFSKLSLLSPDGRSRAFDADANGYVRGEGAGAVLLKPLSRAVADGDPVYAVIRACGINQDGHTSGITVPNQDAQEALLRSTYKLAHISPDDVQYVETHGPGTVIGDPIEARALGNVLCENRLAGSQCVLGSLKPNIGHLEAGAGIAALIKAALVVKHKMIPPNLHFDHPNPSIDFEDLQLRIPLTLEPISDGAGQVVAGVNSFGFGGTNAHVVITGVPAWDSGMEAGGCGVKRPPYILPLTARSSETLQELAGFYRNYLTDSDENSEAEFADICYSACLRRNHFNRRLALVADGKMAASELIDAYLAGKPRAGMVSGEIAKGAANKIAFIYSGQGPQWWAMGRELIEREPVFRKIIERCENIIRELGPWSLLDELTASEENSRIQETSIAQPAIFAIQAALTALWKSWGIEPDMVIGHSIGEVATAYAAGAFSLEEATRIIYHRGRCMDKESSKGKILAAGISLKEAEQIIQGYEDGISIAAINSPSAVSLSGDPAPLEHVADLLEKKDIFARFLQVDYAFHSHRMDHAENDLMEALEGLHPSDTKIPMISTVTGEEINGPELGKEYWWRNVRNSVRFAEGLDKLIQAGCDIFIEISPHPVLALSIKECLSFRKSEGAVLHSLKRSEPEINTMLSTLGSLFVRGYPVDWNNIRRQKRSHVHIPTTPWHRERYWSESEEIRELRLERKNHPFLFPIKRTSVPLWDCEMDLRLYPFLRDHRIQNQVVFPAACYIEMALGTARELFGNGPCCLEDIYFQEAFFLQENGSPPKAQLVFNPIDAEFSIYSKEFSVDNWTLNTLGRLHSIRDEKPPEAVNLDELKEKCREILDKQQFYDFYENIGFTFGPAFRGIDHVRRADNEAVGLISYNYSSSGQDGEYIFHPAMLDSCMQVIGKAITLKEQDSRVGLFLPVQIDRVRFFQKPEDKCWSHVKLVKISTTSIEADIRICGDDGSLLLEISGFKCQRISGIRGVDAGSPEDWIYDVRWHRVRSENENLWQTGIPNHLPPLQPIVESLEALAIRLEKQFGFVGQYNKLKPKLERLAHAYLLKALQDLGWQRESEKNHETESLADELGIQRQYEKAFLHFLDTLSIEGYLIKSEHGLAFSHKRAVLDPEEIWRTSLREFPTFYAELVLLSKIGMRLADILTGEIAPSEFILSEGFTNALEHYYQDSPTFRTSNILAAAAVCEIAKHVPEDYPLRILEAGGKTGGLTSYLLSRLSRKQIGYTFTDTTDRLFQSVKQRFRDYQFVEYLTFDVEKDTEEQGFEPNSFDLLIATDCLQAAGDISKVVCNLRKLISSEGLLILTETIRSSLWQDLIFGFSEDGGKFPGQEKRLDHQLLDNYEMRNALESEGFSDVSIVSDNLIPGNYRNVLLLARGPEVLPKLPVIQPEVTSSSEERTKGNWLILGDSRGVAARLARTLENHGDSCILVFPGDKFKQVGENSIRIPFNCATSLEQILGEATAANRPPLRGVIHMWSLDCKSEETFDEDSKTNTSWLGCLSIVNLVKALDKASLDKPPRLFVLTLGANKIGFEMAPPSLEQALVCGLARVLFNEHPGLRIKSIDLDPDTAEGEIRTLHRELCTDDPQDEIAIRSGEVFVPKVEKLSLQAPSIQFNDADDNNAQPFVLDNSRNGILKELKLMETIHPIPESGQIVIKTFASSLNFRDVMKALGLYPKDSDDYMLLGDECSGVVEAVGDEVRNVNVGDEVIAIAPQCLASHARTLAEFVVRKPSDLSFEEAATLPIAFLTAYYCLHHVARIREGERVLIHAAGGGVGLAAVQIAKRAGAEIFATASSEKQELLRQLGVNHVMDSRSLEFAEHIKQITSGQGIDVVLNSIAGEAIQKGLSVLRPGGRFLEIGKRDIYQNSRIGLRPFRNNLSFHAVDLSQVMAEDPKLVNSILMELSEHFENKTFSPLPFRIFSITRIVEAFRHMSMARHVGKIVITMREQEIPITPKPYTGTSFPQNASYLITGGLGGFGLAVASWLVDSGARNLVLVGRSGASSKEAEKAVDDLRGSGARVLVAEADVSNKEQLGSVLNMVEAEMPPLRGIFHAAMVIDDCISLHLTEERFNKVLEPKAMGAWNLHQLTLGMDLDFFVMFSSISSIIGNPGQANYAAANALLDAMAHYRKSLDLPATTINWGRLRKVGYVEKHEDLKKLFDKIGLKGFTPNQAMQALGLILAKEVAQASVVRTNWRKLMAGIGGPSSVAMRFSNLLGDEKDDNLLDGDGNRIRETLLPAEPNERAAIIQDYILERVSRALATSPSKLDADQPLTDFGLDSLMAIELKNKVESDLEISLPTVELMKGPSIAQLAEIVARLVSGGGPSVSTSEPGQALTDEISLQIAHDSRLISLRDSGTRPPVFCIHPAGGYLNIYRPFADALSQEQPVYGIPSRVLAGESEEHFSIIDMAEEYSSIICSRQPNGPYHLMGFSFGGLVALAIAKVFENQDKEVSFVGLIEPPQLSFPEGDSERKQLYLSNLVFTFFVSLSKEIDLIAEMDDEKLSKHAGKLSAEILSSSPRERSSRILEWLNEWSALKTDLPESGLETFLTLFDRHLSLIPTFQPEAISAPITTWKAQGENSANNELLFDWAKPTAGSYHEVFLEGNHYSIMYPPAVRTLAEQFESRLQTTRLDQR